MPSFVVVAGEMEAGSGISARIDLNLHLAPPPTPEFLRSGDPQQQQQQQQHQHPPQQQQHSQGAEQQQSQEHQLQQEIHQEQHRRILPRFGPGIHGVFLDLHQESEEAGSSSSSSSRRASLAATAFHLGDDEGEHHHQDNPQRDHQPLEEQPRSTMRTQRIQFPRVTRRMPPRITVHDARRSLYQQYRHRVHVGTTIGTTPPRDAPKDKDPVREGGDDDDVDGSTVKPADFECNVCLDIAVEPVVTICGHLFCWHCLYEWLYVHSDNDECPVCKGLVVEGSIIPIYGRGTSTRAEPRTAEVAAAAAEEQLVQDEPSEEPRRTNVPPRPRARRVDSLRQRLETGGSTIDWDAHMDDVDGDGRRSALHIDEVMRMRRAVRYLQDSMGASRRLYRRRMSERREHYRTPGTSSSNPVPATSGEQSRVSGLVASFAGGATAGNAGTTGRGDTGGTATATPGAGLSDLEARANYLHDDYVRTIAASRAETEDRVAVIRARLANLVETIETHRRNASAMNFGRVRLVTSRSTAATSTTEAAAAIAAAAAAAAARLPPPTVAPSDPPVAPVAAPADVAGPSDRPSRLELGASGGAEVRRVSRADRRVSRAEGSISEARAQVEAGEGSDSGGDIESELLHSRKRRRLN